MNESTTPKLPLIRKLWEISTNLALALLWVVFLQAHLAQYLEFHEIRLLLVVVAESIAIAMYLFRKVPRQVSLSPLDWIVGVVGTFAALFFRPSFFAFAPTASNILMLIGVTIQIFGMLSLRRSFGIVAAIREVKTDGLYQFIRHPLYLAYMFIYTGYILGNTDRWNCTLAAIAIISTIVRIFREERILLSDIQYQTYCSKVRWRLIPGVF